MKALKIVISFLMIGITSMSWAATALCKIEIKDVNKASTHRLEYKFTFKKDGDIQRKHFEIPGDEYACTLAISGNQKGTMLSCEYMADMGHTFFQTDRSVLSDRIATNNLAFRHKSAFIVVETRCE